MISDEHFNSLKWQDLDEGDLELLQGAYIDDLEPVWAGYADDNGNMVISGLVLYITDRSSNKRAISIDAPEFDLVPEQIYIKQADLLEGVEA